MRNAEFEHDAAPTTCRPGDEGVTSGVYAAPEDVSLGMFADVVVRPPGGFEAAI